jgi:hypothetical protein
MNLCTKSYGRKFLYNYVRISRRRMNTGSVLSAEFSCFLIMT